MATRLFKKTSFMLWILTVVAIIVTGLIFMPLEKDRPGFWEALYSTFRLFVFERDLPTFPVTWPLIAIYFIAPLVTLSALGTAISYLFRITPFMRTRFLRDHVIICGAGRIGRLMARSLKEMGVSVVMIDNEITDEIEEWSHGRRVPVYIGDFRVPVTLDRCGAGRCRSIVFATGNDLLNIDAAFTAYEHLKTARGAVKLLWTHIADDRLAETMREMVRTEGKVGIRFFDTYHIAARSMIRDILGNAVNPRRGPVYIAGFGKFGSDLLEVLVQDNDLAGNSAITVVDKRDVRDTLARMARHLGVEKRVIFIRSDVRDLRVGTKLAGTFFLCTDDDLGNLSLALDLSTRLRKSRIVVRMGHWPLLSVSEQIGREKGLVFVNINELIEQGIHDMAGLFSAPDDQDLKRLYHR